MTQRASTLVATLLSLALVGLAGAEPQTLGVRSSEPRAFGYTVGDVVTRRIALQVPSGSKLDEESLPRAGSRGRALELQRVVLRRSITGVPEELQLDYQIFLAPRELRVLEIPALVLHFDGSPRAQTLRIDAWPLTVAPLTPAEPSPRDGLGELRPDQEPPRIDTSAVRTRLVAEAAVGALLLAYLAHVYLVLPWSARRRRPFGRAWAALRTLSAEPDAMQRRAAYERLHAALNETAGEVLFEPGLARFVAGQPRFAPLREELTAFFAQSRAEFFAGDPQPGDVRSLLALCRRCRDLERGAA
ncbi:MAG: hypothetical protein ABI702_20010 [Burkholderiales bacterium]